jgi:hypothetical protein
VGLFLGDTVSEMLEKGKAAYALEVVAENVDLGFFEGFHYSIVGFDE